MALIQLRSVPTAHAAAANTVNFQARLQSASGAIVPDGNYNIEFKLYSGVGCNPNDGSGCTTEWTEDYLNSASNGLKTVNGYLSANLGSTTAFPSTIKWDQKMWLSMNIGGTSTGSVTWDGAMKPFLSLTSVPAAFSASQLAATNGSNRSTLTFQGSSNGDQDFVIQDQGAAGTYNLLTANQADISYIQNGTGLQTGDFNISGSGVADTLQGSTAVITPAIRPVSDSTSALQVQNAAGTVNVLTVDTTNDRIGIGTDAPTATVDIKGSTSDGTASALNVQDSLGSSVLNVRNDGQVTIGSVASLGTTTTFGSNTHTTGDTNDSLSLSATKFTTGNTPGTLTSISIWVNGIDPTAANDKYRLAIYSDAGNDRPQTLIAESAEGTLTANSFNTLAVNASLSADTTYWLAYQTNGSSSSYNNFSYTSGTSNQSYYKTRAYGSFPSSGPTGGSNPSIAIAIYGTYTLAGTSTTPALTVAANGNVGIGGVTAPSSALQVQGTVAASALSLTGNGTATAFQAGLFDTASAGALNIGTTNATSVNIGSAAVPSTVTISNGSSGGTFINYASTLNPAAAIANFTSNSEIGTAATTVDIHTSFTINQTTAGISLTIPSPTTTTAGRIIYIANVGSATATINSVVMGPGTSASFFWNGSAWISAAVSTGVSVVGTYSGTSIANGASISGNTLTLGVADGTNPGMVSTGAQTFAGAKTFTDATAIAKTSSTAFQIQNSGGSTTLLTADTSANAVTINGALTASTVTISGGSTANRPSSPTKGMMYFDTTTNTLLTYNGSKWTSDKSTATKIVAMGTATGCSGSSPVASSNPDGADYVVTSCTSAQTTINSAISAVNSRGGGVVYLEEGTYIIDGSITMLSNVTLQGAGDGTIIKLKDNSTNVTMVTMGAVSNVQLQNFKLDGNVSNGNDSDYGIYASGSVGGTTKAGVAMSNLDIENVFGYTVNLSNGGYNSSVTNSYIFSNLSFAVIFSSITNGTIANNTLYGGTSGVYLSGGSNLSVTGNAITGFAAAGIDVAAATNVSVSGNNIVEVSGSNGNGVYLESGTKANVTGNTLNGLAGSGAIGIQDNGSNDVVSGNNVYGWQTGIQLSGTNGNSNGNSIASSTTNSIKVTTAGNMVTGNIITGNASTADSIVVSAGTNKVTNNSITYGNTSSGYALHISSGSGNYLSGNIFSGSSSRALSDGGTSTVYAGQQDSNGITSFSGTLQASSLLAASLDAASAGGTLTLAGSNASTVNIANNAAAHTLNIATGAAAQTVTIGSTNTGSTTKLQAGGSAINVTNSAVAVTGNLQVATIQNLPGLGDTNSISFSSTTGIAVNSADGFSLGSNTVAYLYGSSYTIASTASGVAARIVGQSNQTGDLMQLTNFSNQVLTKFNSNGDLQIGGSNAASSTTALQIKNHSNANVFTVDTATNQTTNNANLNVGSAANTGSAGHLFSDSFESGNNKLWDRGTILDGSSTFAANSTTVHNGKYSMKMVAAGNPSATKASINGGTTTVLRSYVNLTSNTGDLGLMELDSPADSFQLWIDSSNGNKLAFWDNAASTSYLTSTALSTGTWHEVELDLTIGSGTSGAVTVYVDGTSVLTKSGATGINTGTANPTSVTLGTPTADTGTAYFDDVVVDTVRPGDGASVNVGDTLHVGGSSSFSGSAVFQATSSSATAFQIQNSSGTTLLAADTSANAITMGSNGQFSVDGSGNFTTSGTGTIATTSATAFSVQDASNNSYFNVDTDSGTITIGNAASGNYISFSASGGLTAFGSAQHGKKILLTPEYAGAVLDASGDSSCSSANNGTMTSGLATGLTGFGNTTQNYYKWTGSASAQCYDVVVQVPIPSDWGSWTTNPLTVNGYTSDTTNGTLAVKVSDSTGTTETNFNYTGVTPTSTGTWQSKTPANNLSGSYSAGGYLTLRIRMSGNATSTAELGNIMLTYNSKF